MQLKKMFLKVFTFFMSLAMVAGLFSVNTYAREEAETETDITDKVMIDSITSPNAEIKDSENVNDFSSFVNWNSNVDYKIDMTVNKGTPIETGDFIEIPVKADYGILFESHGLSVLDAEDGSILGEATITKDKIRIKFTKNDNTKTAVKLTVSTTLKGVICGLSKGFPTQAEVDAEYAAHPTGINKVKILDKNVNLNVRANYWVTSSEKFYGNYPTPTIGDGSAVFRLENGKSGITSSTNASTHWDVLGGNGTYTYTVTSPATGKTNSTTTTSSALAAFLFGDEKVFSFFSATEMSYIEDTLPADTYKNMKLSTISLAGACLYKDGKTPLLNQSSIEGKFGDCRHLVENASFKFDEVLTKKEATAGQSYEQFKASLKPGEYGIYTSPNGDIRFVASLGKIGSKNPDDIYTWGNFADRVGKETVVRRLFPLFDINTDGGASRITVPQEKIDEIYNKIKDWPISRIAFSFDSDLVKPVMRTGAYVENTAQFIDKSVTAKNFFVVGDISLHTYKDGAAILKTDAKNGQGIENAEFKLQEKDPAGNWVDTDSQYVKDNVTIVGDNGGRKNGDRFYTSENGILNIRGLANNKTYRLVETKAPEGYDNSTPAISREFAISFTDKNAAGDNKDFSITNKKAEYKVTYKIVKNPEGEEIPAGSPTAPVDGSTYTFKAMVDVKPDLVFDGYEFIGWHTENGQTPVVKDTDGSFTMPSKNVELVGYWKRSTKDITIKYISEDINMGTVTVPSETLNDTTGTAKGSVAKEKDGYEFVGWYKLSDAGKTIISTTDEFAPVKDPSDQKYHEETYVAKFKARETISVSVEKKWVGPAAARVDVKLLVDGEERETLTLSAANHWKGEFEELYKYDPIDGHEIQYTVKEVAVEGYTSAISGTVQTGFTITNTITGKVSVPVTKKWIGKEADSVTVHLYADGTDTGKSATLNAANQWQYTFANLEQYKDGKAINYTIKEDSIAGYETKVTGDMKGYIVTNTNTEKLTIPVEKKWIGKEAAQVDVKLLVDGEEKETLTLNAANHWKGEFKNLYKYDQTDGHEIQYTVKEVSVEGYTSAISGTAQTGFTITNTKNPVPPTTPKTGDNSNLSLYIGVAVLALAILGFVIVKRFKSSK